MWSDLAPRRAVGRRRRLLPPAVHPAPSASCAAWFVEQAAPAACASRPTASATGRLVAGAPVGRVPRRHAAVADRVAPRLGARRRGVRRAARRGLRARGGRPAAGARGRARPADRGVGVRRGGGVAVRAGLPRLAAGDRRDRPGTQARELRDRDGVPARRDGRRRARAGARPGAAGWTDRACFVELHVEQGRDLVDRGAAVGVASEIWPHGRYRFDFTGEANHAGTTRMEDRHDPMLTYAMTALAANKQARLAGAARDVRPGRGRAQRHQRDAVAGDRPGWTPGARPTRRWPTLVERDHAAGDRARRAGRHHARRSPPSRCPGRSPSTPPWPAPDRRRPRGRRLAGHPDRGRPRRRHPLGAGDPDRDAVRPQPHRRLALAGRARRDRRLPGRRRRRSPTTLERLAA